MDKRLPDLLICPGDKGCLEVLTPSVPNKLGSNLLTRFYRTLKGLFSSQVKNLKSLPDELLEKWRTASSANEVADMDACNQTTIFQAMTLLKRNSMRIEYFDSLSHPQKYKPLKWTMAKVRQKIPLMKNTGINFKIIARKI